MKHVVLLYSVVIFRVLFPLRAALSVGVLLKLYMFHALIIFLTFALCYRMAVGYFH